MKTTFFIFQRLHTQSALQHHQMLLFSAFDCATCNRAVKRDKANLMLHGRSPYIQIDKLTNHVYFAVILMRRCQESKPWPYGQIYGPGQSVQSRHSHQASKATMQQRPSSSRIRLINSPVTPVTPSRLGKVTKPRS